MKLSASCQFCRNTPALSQHHQKSENTRWHSHPQKSESIQRKNYKPKFLVLFFWLCLVLGKVLVSRTCHYFQILMFDFCLVVMGKVLVPSVGRVNGSALNYSKGCLQPWASDIPSIKSSELQSKHAYINHMAPLRYRSTIWTTIHGHYHSAKD